ncbi:threonine/serine dehydratase [Roseobacter sp. HKCCA0434]|uniref:threonine ammonia-lyase n=1 Tax=Roseobacter sp. HKCCA0434 TaxID=3079297 RepID=UPI002905C744|nr:threonine/serine dehydratase [Roseobacter sp. HKCCA0434]
MSTIERIHAAATVLDGVARRTPMLTSPFLDEIAGRRVLVKAECLQHTGSFKLRGAWFALSQLPEADRARGVIAFSSGNHAQGVAFAAREAGVPAVIVMPEDAPRLKIANTRALGAEVVLYDRETEDRDEIGARLAEERGLSLIKPFDNRDVIAGQGTTGLEIAAQATDLGVSRADVLVCCGGGGLTGGIAVALAETDLTARPVEPEGFDDVARSLAAGRIERNDRLTGSICDAIITPAPGELTFPLMARHCGAPLQVSDAECLSAIGHAFQRLKIVAEPGGAAALAAALHRGDQITGDAVICVVTGGNVDKEIFLKSLA